jgi:hypothetical protein
MVVITSSMTILIERHCLPQVFIRPAGFLLSHATCQITPAIIPAADPVMATRERTINR